MKRTQRYPVPHFGALLVSAPCWRQRVCCSPPAPLHGLVGITDHSYAGGQVRIVDPEAMTVLVIVAVLVARRHLT